MDVRRVTIHDRVHHASEGAYAVSFLDVVRGLAAIRGELRERVGTLNDRKKLHKGRLVGSGDENDRRTNCSCQSCCVLCRHVMVGSVGLLCGRWWTQILQRGFEMYVNG